MLTILEGCDGSGKTTLLQELLAHTNGKHLLRHSEPDLHLTSAQKFLHYLAWIRLARTENVWCDRAWLSCLIYDTVMTGEPRLTVHQRRVLDRLALSAEVAQVICVPPREHCLGNWRRRMLKGGEYVPEETKIQQVFDAYEKEVFSPPRLPIIGYNYLGAGSSIVRETLPYLRTQTNLGPGVGRWREDVVLLVGDRPNRSNTYLGPFCAPTGCSPWLSEQLEASGISELELYWVNSMDEFDRHTDPRFVDELKPRTVISLGNHADRWCQDHGIHRIMHAHPQAWKRFHSHEPYPLLGELQRLRTPHKVLEIRTEASAVSHVLH